MSPFAGCGHRFGAADELPASISSARCRSALIATARYQRRSAAPVAPASSVGRRHRRFRTLCRPCAARTSVPARDWASDRRLAALRGGTATRHHEPPQRRSRACCRASSAGGSVGKLAGSGCGASLAAASGAALLGCDGRHHGVARDRLRAQHLVRTRAKGDRRLALARAITAAQPRRRLTCANASATFSLWKAQKALFTG
jgi:hypothetical protein